MSWAGFWKSYRLLITGVAVNAAWMLRRRCALKLPRNHLISFAGIHHTCQNIQHIRHKTDFFSSHRCQQLTYSGN